MSLDTFGRNGLLEKVINDQPFDGDIIAEALNGTRRIYDKYKAVFQSDELIRLEAVDYCDNVYVIEIRIEHSLKDRLFAKTVAARDRKFRLRFFSVGTVKIPISVECCGHSCCSRCGFDRVSALELVGMVYQQNRDTFIERISLQKHAEKRNDTIL